MIIPSEILEPIELSKIPSTKKRIIWFDTNTRCCGRKSSR